MPDTRTIQTNFTGGEVSPNVIGRTDNKRYQSGAAVLENMIVTDQGGVTKRNGTQAVDAQLLFSGANVDIKDVLDPFGQPTGGKVGCRMIPFIVTKDESYSLALMAKHDGSSNFIGTDIRVYDNKNKKFLRYMAGNHDPNSNSPPAFEFGDGVDPDLNGTSSDWTPRIYYLPPEYDVAGNPTPDAYDNTGHWVGKYVMWNDNWYECIDNTGLTDIFRYDVSQGKWEVRNLGPTVLVWNQDGGLSQPYFFPWTAEELNEIDYAQNDNEIYLVHKNHAPVKISRKKVSTNNSKSGVSDYRRWDGGLVKFYDGPFLTTKQGKKLKVGALDPEEDTILSVDVKVDDTYLSASKPSDLTYVGGIDKTSEWEEGDPLDGVVDHLTTGKWVEYSRGDKKLLGEVTDVSDIANGNIIVDTKDNILEVTEEGATFESDNIYPNLCTNIMSTSSVFSKNHEGYYFKHTQLANIWEVYKWSLESNGAEIPDTASEQDAMHATHVLELDNAISSGTQTDFRITFNKSFNTSNGASQADHFGIPYRGVLVFSNRINSLLEQADIDNYLSNSGTQKIEFISYNGITKVGNYWLLHNVIRGQHGSTVQTTGASGFNVWPMASLEDVYTSQVSYLHSMECLRWRPINNWYKIRKYCGTKVTHSYGHDSKYFNKQVGDPKLATWSGSTALMTDNETVTTTNGTGLDFGKFVYERKQEASRLECYNNVVKFNSTPRAGITADIIAVDPVRTSTGLDAQIEFIDNAWASDAKELTPNESLYQTKRVILAEVSSSRDVFVASRDLNRQIRLDFNGEKVWGRIIKTDAPTDEFYAHRTNFAGNGAITASRCVVSFDVPLPVFIGKNRDNVTHDWQFGAWHSSSTDDEANYPQSVAFFENRLVFGGSRYNPQDLWFSKLSDYETFSLTDEKGNVLDSSSIQYTIASDDVSAIQWLSPSNNLLVGTTVAEWRVASSDQTVTLSPTNITISQQTQFGSDGVSPVRVGGSTIFVQAPGKVVRELAYNYETNSYRAIDLTSVAEHLFTTDDPVVQCESLRYPHNFIFFRTKRGRLICVTYEKENDVVAATRITLGGFQPFDITEGSVPTQNWATNVEYSIQNTVVHEGVTYQGAKKHTSTDFLTDYAEGNWIHCGGSVVGMASMPASTPDTADELFLAVYRHPYHIDAASGDFHSHDPILCFERLAPLGSSKQALVGGSKSPMDIVPVDFNMTFQTETERTFNYATAMDWVAAQADLTQYWTNIPNPSFDTNYSPWTYILSAAGNASDYLEGIAGAIYLVDRGATVSTSKYFTPYPDRYYQAFDGSYATGRYDSTGNGIKNSWTLLTDRIAGTPMVTRPDNFPWQVGWGIGFQFPSRIKTLPLEVAFQGGTSVGRIRRINEVSLLLRNTGSFYIGGKNFDLVLEDELQYDGVKTVSLDFDYEEMQDFAIISMGPQNLQLLAYSPEVTINR